MSTTQSNEREQLAKASDELRRAADHLDAVVDIFAARQIAKGLRLTANAMDFGRDPQAGSWFPLALAIARQVNAEAAAAKPEVKPAPAQKRVPHERVQEILDQLNGFGDVDFAIAWANGQADVVDARANDVGEAEVELVGGPDLVRSPFTKRWMVTIAESSESEVSS